MIFGKLLDLEKKIFDEQLQFGLKFLKEQDLSLYSLGIHEINESLSIVAIDYETKVVGNCFWEAHKKNIDIHYLIEGNENIAMNHIERQKVTEEYNKENDVTIFDGDVQTLLTMHPGDVLVCYPEDSHMTGIMTKEIQKVKKVVLKLKV